MDSEGKKKRRKNIRLINPATITELAWLVKFLLWDSTGKFCFFSSSSILPIKNLLLFYPLNSQFVFVVLFTSFLVLCVDYDRLFNHKFPTFSTVVHFHKVQQ